MTPESKIQGKKNQTYSDSHYRSLTLCSYKKTEFTKVYKCKLHLQKMNMNVYVDCIKAINNKNKNNLKFN